MDIAHPTDTYVSLLLSLAHLSPASVIGFFFLIMARVLPIIFFAPFFGAKSLPGPAKIGIGICFSVIFLPQALLQSKESLDFDYLFFFYMLKEALIGFILGFFVTIPFYIAQSTGSLIDHSRGAASLQVTDPSTQTQTGPIGLLYNYVLIAVFFIIGGPFYFLDAVRESFIMIPPASFVNPDFFSLQVPFWKLTINLIDHVFRIAIQLGAPAIIGMLIADMFLGIANRLAPQVQIVFLGISLKSWIGIALLAASWYFVLIQMEKESASWIKTIHNILPSLSQLVQH